ncbi:hypothetical protein Hamer_G026323 [Homarus americanus]|uniref:Uncharacterized protein n=1 Tax=Homarus americanus TaxID=6706 RepID=A0A8J5J7P8_HOMAM|nr:hypothetical protein Hamer_G026323 [Homarus americanus]
MTATTVTPLADLSFRHHHTPAGSVMTATTPLHLKLICHGCHSLLHPKLDLSCDATHSYTAGSVMTATHSLHPADLSPLTVTPLAGSVMAATTSLHPAGSVAATHSYTP